MGGQSRKVTGGHWSALGQSRPNWAIPSMSAFPPIATGKQTSRIGSFVPIPDLRPIKRIIGD
jgi:hypothetical protein